LFGSNKSASQIFRSKIETLEGKDDPVQKEEDVNGPIPHVWLSSENWSDGSVGRTQGPESETGS